LGLFAPYRYVYGEALTYRTGGPASHNRRQAWLAEPAAGWLAGQWQAFVGGRLAGQWQASPAAGWLAGQWQALLAEWQSWPAESVARCIHVYKG